MGLGESWAGWPRRRWPMTTVMGPDGPGRVLGGLAAPTLADDYRDGSRWAWASPGRAGRADAGRMPEGMSDELQLV
jgi:hypothetical protein